MNKLREKAKKRQGPIVDLEDLRDDTIAVVLNSGLSFEGVHRQGGPTSQTLSKWLHRETRFPRIDTVRATLQACGYDFFVLPQKVAEADTVLPTHIRQLKPSTTQTLPKRKMQARKDARKAARRRKG